MTNTLVIEQLQRSTAVASACSVAGCFLHQQSPAHHQQLLVCSQDELVLFGQANEQGEPTLRALGASSCSCAFRALLRIPWYTDSGSSSDRVLGVTDDNQCLLLSLKCCSMPAAQPSGRPPLSLPPSPALPNEGAAAPPQRLQLHQHACIQLSTPPSLAPLPCREDGVRVSLVLQQEARGSVRVALSVFHDIVHVLQITSTCQREGGTSKMAVLTVDLKREALLALQPSKKVEMREHPVGHAAFQLTPGSGTLHSPLPRALVVIIGTQSLSLLSSGTQSWTRTPKSGTPCVWRAWRSCLHPFPRPSRARMPGCWPLCTWWKVHAQQRYNLTCRTHNHSTHTNMQQHEKHTLHTAHRHAHTYKGHTSSACTHRRKHTCTHT